MRRGWSSRVAESGVVFLPTRPPKRCQLSFALGGLTLACLSLSAVCRLAQGRAVGSPDGVAASGGDAVTSRRPPTGGFLSEPGRCPTGDLVWSFESRAARAHPRLPLAALRARRVDVLADLSPAAGPGAALDCWARTPPLPAPSRGDFRRPRAWPCLRLLFCERD